MFFNLRARCCVMRLKITRMETVSWNMVAVTSHPKANNMSEPNHPQNELKSIPGVS